MSDNLQDISVSALRKASVSVLSSGLNHLKVIPNKSGLPRDWRGLAHLVQLNSVDYNLVNSSVNPTEQLLSLWSQKGTLGQLKKYLEELDRFDVLDDSLELIAKDVEVYNGVSKSYTPGKSINENYDSLVLTVDDIVRFERGESPQNYDGFLLFAEENSDFAMQIVDKMENQYGMKLCLRDRDLVGGITFEHEAVMKLIAERCNRLVVVVSSAFLKSAANKFFVTFAQALGIDQRQRKVIPILYEWCQLPPELSYYFLLNYTRSGVLWNFWEKLRDSLRTPTTPSVVASAPPLWIENKSKENNEQHLKEESNEKVDSSGETIKTKKPVLKSFTTGLTNMIRKKGSKNLNKKLAEPLC